MAKIGGNITGRFQVCNSVKNQIGEGTKIWLDVIEHKGFLDMQSGDSKYTNFNAKIQESTHIFVCDFDSTLYALADRDARAVFKGFVYDVLFFDNPMELNEQLEIYLRRVGAYNG